MAKLTQDMKDVMEKTRGYAVATCTKEGTPNVVCIHFVKILSDDEIMLADIDMQRAKEVAQYVDSEKIKTDTVNASDKADVANLLKKGSYDLVVNATLMTFNRQIIEAALEAGVHYLDMASNEFFTQKEGKTYLVEQRGIQIRTIVQRRGGLFLPRTPQPDRQGILPQTD